MRLLDGELSALGDDAVSFVWRERAQKRKLTDNTLSREVFPAFWRPIMVTSISVALCNMIRMIRLLETKTPTLWWPGSTSKMRACSHGSPRDELSMV